MTKNKYNYWLLIGVVIFVAYFFLAARPVPVETVLVPQWLSSTESNYPLYLNDASAPAGEGTAASGEDGTLLPFRLGNRFGYIDAYGRFSVNREKKAALSIAEDYWAEYEAIPREIGIRDSRDQQAAVIQGGRGYPLFLDGRLFMINAEQNSLEALDASGGSLWTHDFAAPITDIDAASGLVLAGLLDGTIELLDENGRRIFFFEPGGSRLSVICACRISRDGTKLAIISGYDDQRFLFLERLGDSYKVSYHEFISDGFRRVVHLAFIDQDQRVVFEREGGIGIYDIDRRANVKVEMDGRVNSLDHSGEDDLLFVITSRSERRKELVGVRLPGEIIIKAPFRSEAAFLRRKEDRLYVGGGGTLASFRLERK
ncbi:MAG: WD40 repeat domain-containing protein [Spirochaetaceae bacterium]|jgi:hypothetical protein|nr:WD40 repeat domain-containing protein [Spirochaetaceae bacterium]